MDIKTLFHLPSHTWTYLDNLDLIFYLSDVSYQTNLEKCDFVRSISFSFLGAILRGPLLLRSRRRLIVTFKVQHWQRKLFDKHQRERERERERERRKNERTKQLFVCQDCAIDSYTKFLRNFGRKSWAVLVVKWSACSPSLPTIRVWILLKPIAVFICKICVWKERKGT